MMGRPRKRVPTLTLGDETGAPNYLTREELGRVTDSDLLSAFSGLTLRERQTLLRRYDIYDNGIAGLLKVEPAATLRETGKDLGISKERVRRLEDTAFAKLRISLIPLVRRH
jgi:DNA-directed RNA polymerase sigma subunit (sigma70/sigma32)